jgi:hypothetical protein
MKRWIRNLRDPKAFHKESGRVAKPKARRTMALWKSDQSIVV